MIDQECDDAVLGLVGDAFDGVRLERDTGSVIARGRTLRRRRKAMSAFAATGVLALSLGLAAATATSSGTGHNLAYNGAVVNVDNAAFSVHTDVRTGTVKVTIRRFTDPAELKAVLAKAGIRSNFQLSKPTVSAGHPYYSGCALPAGVHSLDGSAVFGNDPMAHTVDGTEVVTINPAGMPPGSVLNFTYITASAGAAQDYAAVESTLLTADPGPTCMETFPVQPKS